MYRVKYVSWFLVIHHHHLVDLWRGSNLLVSSTSFLITMISQRTLGRRENKIAINTVYALKLANDMHDKKLGNMMPQLTKVFQNVLNDIKPTDAKDNDLVRIYINHDALTVPIIITPRQWVEMTGDVIMDKIAHVLSSQKSLRVDESLDIHVGSISIPNGGSRSNVKNVSCLKAKRSVVAVANNDKLCMARALVVAMAKADNSRRYDSIKKKIAADRLYMLGPAIRKQDSGMNVKSQYPIFINLKQLSNDK